jgi:hypothetical protein
LHVASEFGALPELEVDVILLSAMLIEPGVLIVVAVARENLDVSGSIFAGKLRDEIPHVSINVCESFSICNFPNICNRAHPE